MKIKWNKLSATERASIIGGLFVLFTAILIPCIDYFRTDTIDLEITDIRIIQFEKSFGVEVLFWNKSNLPISVTLINLSLKNSDSMREPFGQSIYHLSTDIHILSKSSGYFTGESIPDTSDISKNYISYPISGDFHYSKERENWSIYLDIPIREELMSHRNQSIIIKFPHSITIVEEQESESDSLGSNINKKELLFSKIINDCKEPIQVLLSVVYANNKKVKAKTSLTLNSVQ